MTKLYNVDHQPAVADHGKPAVRPGESYDFTKDQVEAGIAGQWSEENPRKGLKQEREFKRARDKAPVTAETDPAEPEKE
jgi:hypothetical protein